MINQIVKKISNWLIIIIILTIVSYPIYAHYKVVSRRHGVVLALKRLAIRMNEYYSLQGDYKKATPHMLMLEEINKNPGYKLHIVRHEDKHFTINAEPIGKQKNQDPGCGTLSLTDSGKKYITGPGNVKDCWFL